MAIQVRLLVSMPVAGALSVVPLMLSSAGRSGC
jgi:hypothetical protein